MFTRRLVTLVLLVIGLMALGATAALAADDVGVVDSDSGVWYLRDSATGNTTSFYYGNPGDLAFAGDWDCDGVDTPGLYRQRDGYVYLRNSNTQGNADIRFYFGDPGDVPVAGDFDGDGCDTVSIYRPSIARFFIINALGENGKGLGSADFAFTFGDLGDSPLAGDWDADGADGVGVVRAGFAYLTNALKAGAPSATVEVSEDDVPLVGKWAAADAPAGYHQSSGSFNVPGKEPLQYGNAHTSPMAGEFGALAGGSDAPSPPPPYPDIGDGKRIIYSNSAQRVWLIDKDNVLIDSYLVSGRIGIPHDGTYSVFSKSVNAWAPYGGITMKHMVRFVRPGTWGNQWSYGFHSIPEYSDGRPMQTEAQMGTHRSGGCVRQPNAKAYALFQWADIGTTVHAIP